MFVFFNEHKGKARTHEQYTMLWQLRRCALRVLNRGAQADARGATQVLDRGGQAVAPAAVASDN